jgi:transcriptional regulator with XRE-family HTH domain
MPGMPPLSLRIREFREARGWSQLRLAEEARARQATISGLETGKIQRIELPMLERIAKALGVEPGELFGHAPAARKGKRR